MRTPGWSSKRSVRKLVDLKPAIVICLDDTLQSTHRTPPSVFDIRVSTRLHPSVSQVSCRNRAPTRVPSYLSVSRAVCPARLPCCFTTCRPAKPALSRTRPARSAPCGINTGYWLPPAPYKFQHLLLQGTHPCPSGKNPSPSKCSTAISVDTASAHLGIEFLEVGDDFITARVPVDAPHTPALWPAARRRERGAGRNTGLLRRCVLPAPRATRRSVWTSTPTTCAAATSGWVTGTARPVHIGRTTQVWQIELAQRSRRADLRVAHHHGDSGAERLAPTLRRSAGRCPPRGRVSSWDGPARKPRRLPVFSAQTPHTSPGTPDWPSHPC